LARSKILFYIKIFDHVIADQVLFYLNFLNTFCITQYIHYSQKIPHILTYTHTVYAYTHIHVKLHLNDLINQNFMINKNAFSLFHLVDISYCQFPTLRFFLLPASKHFLFPIFLLFPADTWHSLQYGNSFSICIKSSENIPHTLQI